MAKPRLFRTATQDSKGFWWAEDEDGNRYPVDPYSDDEGFTGYRQVDRRFDENQTQQGAGLPMESVRWKSGQVLTPQDMAQISQVMSTPGAYVGVNGPMSVDQYLADPRSAVKVENGQYVYRPEQSQGDWESIDRESFLQSLGALPFVLGSFAMPYLSSLGIIGPGANVMGQTGDMNFLGDMASGVGGTPTTGSFTGDFPMDAPSYAMESTVGAGEPINWDMINETGSFAGDSTAGWNVAETGGNGVNFSQSYNPVNTLESLTTPIDPINTNLTVGGMNNVNTLIDSIASGGVQTIGSVGAGTGAAAGFGMANGVAGAGGWFDTLLNSLSGTPAQNILKTIGAAAEWFQSEDEAKKFAESINNAVARGDPFGSERPFYQNMLRQSYSDPNFFKNNPVFKGLNDVATSDASRVAAARGFNNSSNLLYDIADRVQKTGYNYANQFQGQLGQLAGGGISPGTSAQIAAQGANQVMQANQQANGAMGNTIAGIPNLVKGIKDATSGWDLP